MGSNDTLGHTGRTGGEDHIQRRGAHQTAAGFFQQGLVRRGIQNVFHHQNPAGKVKGFRQFCVLLIHQHCICLNDTQNLIQTGHRHGGIHRRIEAACPDRTQVASRSEHMAAGHDHHRRAGLQKACQVSTDGFGVSIQLTEGQSVFLIGKHSFFRIGYGGFIQPFQNG